MLTGGSFIGQETFVVRSKGVLPANSPTPWFLTKGLIATSNPMLSPVLSKSSLAALKELHGIGPNANRVLVAEMKKADLSFGK